tara:strand:- start:213 stop:491 length:279 start_codon:yes stop_codon:yes gene_type:complete
MREATQHGLAAKRALLQTGGRIFAVDYKKTDGTFRRVVARLHVGKGVKGTGPGYNRAVYIKVFDMHANGFRTLILDQIAGPIKCGKIIEVTE